MSSSSSSAAFDPREDCDIEFVLAIPPGNLVPDDCVVEDPPPPICDPEVFDVPIPDPPPMDEGAWLPSTSVLLESGPPFFNVTWEPHPEIGPSKPLQKIHIRMPEGGSGNCPCCPPKRWDAPAPTLSTGGTLDMTTVFGADFFFDQTESPDPLYLYKNGKLLIRDPNGSGVDYVLEADGVSITFALGLESTDYLTAKKFDCPPKRYEWEVDTGLAGSTIIPIDGNAGTAPYAISVRGRFLQAYRNGKLMIFGIDYSEVNAGECIGYQIELIPGSPNSDANTGDWFTFIVYQETPCDCESGSSSSAGP